MATELWSWVKSGTYVWEHGKRPLQINLLGLWGLNLAQTKPDTVAIAKRHLLTGTWCGFSLGGLASN